MVSIPAAEVSGGAAVEIAIAEEMRRDERVFYLGTLPPDRLRQEFDESRVRQVPISESGFTGAAVGAAATGLRPVVFWRNVTFSFVAFDWVINQVSKLAYMSGGQRKFPVTLIATCGGGFRVGAQHSHSPHSIFAHVSGIKVALPSTPAEAKALVKASIRDDDPTIVLVPVTVEARVGPIGGEDDVLAYGEASVRRSGEDVTVVVFGSMVQPALDAAERLNEEGISIEVIDPRTVSPLDVSSIRRSVERTGRLVVVDEATPVCSMTSEVAAIVAGDPATFGRLRAPIGRVNALNVPVPYSPPLEDLVLPSVDEIVSAVKSTMAHRNA